MPCFAAVLPVATLVQITGESAMSATVWIGPDVPRSRNSLRWGSFPWAAIASMTRQSAPSIPMTTARVPIPAGATDSPHAQSSDRATSNPPSVRDQENLALGRIMDV